MRLRVGAPAAQEFDGASLEALECTFSLRAIPGDHRAVAEQARVLRPDGRLLLADYIASTHAFVQSGQLLGELVSVPLGGERIRRPIELVTAAELSVEEHDRFAPGIVERLAARKPHDGGNHAAREGHAPGPIGGRPP